jgi:RNA polymerase-binding transcription factor DksA
MADAGTDSNEREKAFHLYNRQTDYHKSLIIALERIENGTFGVCTISGELIPEERMLEVPNATKRVEHKEAEKLKLPKK